MADVVDTTEFPGSDFVPIDDGLVGVSVLQQTVGVVDDLVVCELPTHSTPHSEGGDLNWLDKNEKRVGAFFLSFLDDESECDPSFNTLPRGCSSLTWCIAKTEGLHTSHRWSEVFEAQRLLCYGFLSPCLAFWYRARLPSALFSSPFMVVAQG
jgi:hypothetical protein